MSSSSRGRAGRPLAASRPELQLALDDREEALATLLERPGGPETLLRSYGGEPERLSQRGRTSGPVVRIPLKWGAVGEVLDIQLRGANSTEVERVLYRCLTISSGDSIESTPRDYTATWYAAQLFAQGMKVPAPSRWKGLLRQPKAARMVSGARPTAKAVCRICGRRKLSRQEYNWRRKNGYAVWRCQHRRPSPAVRRELLEAYGVIAGLVLCIVLVRL